MVSRAGSERAGRFITTRIETGSRRSIVSMCPRWQKTPPAMSGLASAATADLCATGRAVSNGSMPVTAFLQAPSGISPSTGRIACGAPAMVAACFGSTGLPRIVPVFSRYTTAEGMSSNQVTAVVEDRLGRIYAGTARGIDRLDPPHGTDPIPPRG